MFIKPTADDFMAYFVRDFPYGSTLEFVMPADIDKAIGQASVNFNNRIWSDQETFTIAFLYLTAHYLVIDLQASSQGLSGKYSWLTTNKAVGNVSEGYQVPQRILDNPYLAQLSKTNYGAKFLQLALPRLVGPMFPTPGKTLP